MESVDNGDADERRRHLANMTSEEELMSDDERIFLYARAVHSNHSIQYHMHQIME